MEVKTAFISSPLESDRGWTDLLHVHLGLLNIPLVPRPIIFVLTPIKNELRTQPGTLIANEAHERTDQLSQSLALLGEIDELLAHLVQAGGEPRPILRERLVHFQRLFVRSHKGPAITPRWSDPMFREGCTSSDLLLLTYPALQYPLA